MQLLIGMTTAPRPTPYLGRALSSLRAAGFDQPVHLFAEPGSPFEGPPDEVTLHVAAEGLGCFPNWRRGLATLHTLADGATWLLMLQDDVVWCRGGRALLASFLDDVDRDGFGFASPYTSPAMVGVSPDFTSRRPDPGGMQAWTSPHFYNNAFWGAAALVFSRESAGALLEFPRFTQHDHHRKVDVLVGNCMRDMGRRMFIAVPSLCDHIGAYSTLGRHRIRGIQWGRRGYHFDPSRGVHA